MFDFEGWPLLQRLAEAFFLFIVLMCLSTGKKATFMTQADNNELYMSYLAIFRGNSIIMEDLLLENDTKHSLLSLRPYFRGHFTSLLLCFRHIVVCDCNLFIAKLLLFSFPTAKLQYDKMTAIIWT